ncbi:MAG: hypothetical protein ACREYE_16010, partial [Gammaproteobacteria bacterium]
TRAPKRLDLRIGGPWGNGEDSAPSCKRSCFSLPDDLIAFGRHPHAAARAMLLEVAFVRAPQINA